MTLQSNNNGYLRKIGRVKALPFLEERYIIKFTSEHKGELVLQAERKEKPSTHNLIWIMPT